ncbi:MULTISPECIES: hypothetical protein [Chryseobacterium]|uniref:Uncharacterized protein n=1 Tax=Chryseobacterium pennae TaxID=2258962 RepID=A0A3D9CER7_9FLAO|nr:MULTISPECIES: hypothetical protein [Chryseobacterium]MCS4303204.1 hypothetical protein [Chryseobacterium sp. BIGb0232]REC64234.1 hypothetical protein DRF65_01265 [Chryseobacterium pennae]ROS14509.1 hypothetical protein EDF65_3285 [Chryseobacterium nakagawai]
MKNTFLGLISVSILAVSCKKDERATYLKEEAGTQQPSVAINNAPKASLMDQAGIQSSTPSTAMATAPGMNPPHGQPGHRCDIPVGQPLNSQPAATPASQNISVGANNAIQIDPNSAAPAQVTVNNNSKPVKTAPGMNPPHGQPGHRCDIPVGQPLNGKPAPASQTAQNNIQVTPTPTPAQAASQNLAMGEKPKINPAHGEPWHSCSLKVGDPLP